MNKYTSIYDLLPDALYVVDKSGNVAYGSLPLDSDFEVFEHICTLCEKEYIIKYFFTSDKKEAAKCFHHAFKVVLSLVDGSKAKTTHTFAHIYTFMTELMRNEISQNIPVSPVNLNKDFGSVMINEKSFIAVISTISHYLCKKSYMPKISYFNDLFDFKVMLTCENLQCDIPVFLKDFCCEAAKKNGFELCFDYADGDFSLTAVLEKTCAEGSFMRANSETFDYLYLICELLCI